MPEQSKPGDWKIVKVPRPDDEWEYSVVEEGVCFRAKVVGGYLEYKLAIPRSVVMEAARASGMVELRRKHADDNEALQELAHSAYINIFDNFVDHMPPAFIQAPGFQMVQTIARVQMQELLKRLGRDISGEAAQ